MRHHFINSLSESTQAFSLSLSQNAQMASNHHTSHLSISELHAAHLTQELSLAQSRQSHIINKVYNCISSFLPVFKPFSARTLSWRPRIHTHSKRTHNTRFTHTHTHTHTHSLHCVCGSYFFHTHVNGRAFILHKLRFGSAFKERCVCSSTVVIFAARAELKWQRIVLYEAQDCL